MQFQVPQFIEVEDKIFGPLTFKQFIWIIGGLGGAYLIYRTLPFLLAVPFAIAIICFAGALAFVSWNGRPFITVLESAFAFLTHNKLYLWNNTKRNKSPIQVEKALANESRGGLYVPKLSDSRLHELAWSLDIKERIAQGVGSDTEKITTRDNVVRIQTARDALVR